MIKETAKSFVRVRLTRIEGNDLNLFEFDFDLTMSIFFLDPSGKKVYARYGQRNANNADDLQSLAGLEYTMKSVLAMHGSGQPQFAPRASEAPRYVSDLKGGGKRCMHCHNVREAMNRELKQKGLWSSERAWHFPLPTNIGVTMEVDRGNVVAEVKPQSAADRVGLRRGDQLTFAGPVPVHSIADLQYALEHLPAKAEVKLQWQRDGAARDGVAVLSDGWRKSDISWRASLRGYVPRLALGGKNLTADERKQFGLTPTQLAFRLSVNVSGSASAVGFRAGDIILGVEGQPLDDMDDVQFHYWMQSHYLIGDPVVFAIIRDGRRSTLAVQMR
jgi:hypothetical protein